MTLTQYSKLYGKSERTIKPYKAQGLPLDDEQAMRQIIGLKSSRLGVSKLSRKVPIAAQVPEPEPDLLSELNKAISDLIGVHFAMVRICWDDADLRARLKPVFDITRPYIEEPED